MYWVICRSRWMSSKAACLAAVTMAMRTHCDSSARAWTTPSIDGGRVPRGCARDLLRHDVGAADGGLACTA